MLRLSLLLLVFASALHWRVAGGAERVGDALYLQEIQLHARALTVLDNDFFSLAETSPDEERFSLYWTYNQMMGTWLQVDYLQTLLRRAVSAASSSDEDGARVSLRDQAQYLLWELDDTNAGLEQRGTEIKGRLPLQLNATTRFLFLEIRSTVDRLLMDQCARVTCASGP